MARERGIIKRQSDQVAIDSTGYESGHVSVYYGKRCGLKKSHYPKLTVVCETISHLYLCAVADYGPLPDDIDLADAVKQALLSQPFKRLLADAGYDSEKNHRFLREELGVESVIPPRRGPPTNKLPRGKWRRKMALEFPKECYAQRWQVESCFSQDKRRFGSALRARSRQRQYGELYLRALIHNIAILWRVCFMRRLAAALTAVFSTQQEATTYSNTRPLLALPKAEAATRWQKLQHIGEVASDCFFLPFGKKQGASLGDCGKKICLQALPAASRNLSPD